MLQLGDSGNHQRVQPQWAPGLLACFPETLLFVTGFCFLSCPFSHCIPGRVSGVMAVFLAVWWKKRWAPNRCPYRGTVGFLNSPTGTPYVLRIGYIFTYNVIYRNLMFQSLWIRSRLCFTSWVRASQLSVTVTHDVRVLESFTCLGTRGCVTSSKV